MQHPDPGPPLESTRALPLARLELGPCGAPPSLSQPKAATAQIPSAGRNNFAPRARKREGCNPARQLIFFNPRDANEVPRADRRSSPRPLPPWAELLTNAAH